MSKILSPGDSGMPSPVAECKAMGRGEKWVAGIVFVAVLVLRFRFLFVCRFDTDESQHLHVAWGWTQHLLPYRDFFDNHVPLFHILFAQVLRLFGERSDILIVMRFAMVPLWLGSVWCFYLIGKRAFGLRAGLWSALLATSSARFFFKMGEFRTDVLWTFLWFLALAIFVGGKPSVRRWGSAGLVLGTALAVSLKTSIMLAAVALSGVIIYWIVRKISARTAIDSLPASIASALLGLVIVPALVAGWFISQGAGHLMYHYVIEHNALPSGGSSQWLQLHMLQLGMVFAVCSAAVVLAFALVKRSAHRARAFRQIAVILPMAVYYVTIRFLWPIVTAQDYAPLDPLFFVCLTPLLLEAGRRLACWFPRLPLRLAPVCLMFGFNSCQMFMAENPLKNSTSGEIAMVSDVLTLTGPGQMIMDAKGETIYRPRAYFFVLETLTLKRMELGLLKDDIVPTLIEKRPPVFHGAARLPAADQKWERSNYISVGTVDVLGKIIPKAEAEIRPFQIEVAERYTIVTNHGSIEGTLDGEPFTGPRLLSPGTHAFAPRMSEPEQKFAILWARAAEKGYSPFRKSAAIDR